MERKERPRWACLCSPWGLEAMVVPIVCGWKTEGYPLFPLCWKHRSMLTGKSPESHATISNLWLYLLSNLQMRVPFFSLQFNSLLLAAQGPNTHCHGPLGHVLEAGDIYLITRKESISGSQPSFTLHLNLQEAILLACKGSCLKATYKFIHS